jgi:hypothetical protein
VGNEASSIMTLFIGFLAGVSITNFIWTIYHLRNSKYRIVQKATQPKPLKFFTFSKEDKKKPKVHDESAEWALENDRKIPN